MTGFSRWLAYAAVLVLLLSLAPGSARSRPLAADPPAASSGAPIAHADEQHQPAADSRILAQTSDAQTLIFEPEADAAIGNTPSTQDVNYGTETSFDVDGNPESEGLIRFTVAGGNGAVTSATLHLFVRDGSDIAPLIAPAASDWDEATVTWNTRPARIGAPIETAVPITVEAFAEFDVTQLVGGNGTFTFNLIGQSGDRIKFTSRESGASTQRPVLVVQFDPAAPSATATPTFTPTPPPTSTPEPTATSAVQVREFTVEADAYVANTISETHINFGAETSIIVDSDPQFDGLLRFTVAGVAGGVTRAILRLYCRDGTDSAPIVVAANNDWDEASVTWATWAAHEVPGGEPGSPIAPDTYVEIDVTALVGRDGTFSFRLIGTSADGTAFTSRESSAEAQRPRLIVDYSPLLPTATISPTPTAAPTEPPPETVGNRDHAYGRGTFAPTAKEGQSKVWYAGGVWWGALFYPATGDYFIASLDPETQTWSQTRTKIDARNNARIDTLWDEESGKLYTVATMARSGAEIIVRRFSFEDGAWSLDSDFTDEPVATTGAVDGVVTIARDSEDVLWVSYVPFEGEKFVYVTHSSPSPEEEWVEPFIISDSAVPLREEEISTVVAFDGQIGVMWSDQDRDTVQFARHVDGTPDREWINEIAFSAPGGADNHIDLKADPEGRVYAAIKTSFHEPDEPLLVLLVRLPDGLWVSTTFSTVADNQTRPKIVIDQRTGTLFYFAADYELNRGTSGGRIYYKQAPLDTLVFEPGKGEVAISGAENPALNNVSSTKQLITDGMGILVIASDDQTRTYWHALLP
ncbi:MAG: DNRLRE domain-containing protein [Chloroflexota bacterium]|nr:DNRLRE domain-containing protein [Chloroflexota bacterium]